MKRKQNLFPLLVFGSVLIVALVAIVSIDMRLDERNNFPSLMQNSLMGKAASTGGYDVVLRDDILEYGVMYSFLDIKTNPGGAGTWRWFSDILWRDGYWVLSGDCEFTKGFSGPFDQTHLKGGLYLFKRDGTYVDTYDKCGTWLAGTSSGERECGHDNFCRAGRRLQPALDDSKFIMDLATTTSDTERPPVLMEVAPSGFVQHASPPNFPTGRNIPQQHGLYRFIDGKIVGVESEKGWVSGSSTLPIVANSLSYNNVLYDLPSFNIINKWNKYKLPEFQPVASSGKYLVAQKPMVYSNLFGDRRKLSTDVYKLENNEFTEVQHLFDYTEGTLVHARIDGPSNYDLRDHIYPDRIHLVLNVGTPSLPKFEMRSYGPAENGLELLRTRSFEYGDMPLAVAGEYIATRHCPKLNRYNKCAVQFSHVLRISKGDEILSVEPSPGWVDYKYETCKMWNFDPIGQGYNAPGYARYCPDIKNDPQPPGPFEIAGLENAEFSPDGDLVVVTVGQVVHLFKVENWDPYEEEESVCGDGVCNDDETQASCSADCAGDRTCSNGVCESGETTESCPADCASTDDDTYSDPVDPNDGEQYLTLDMIGTESSATLYVDAGGTGRFIYFIGYYLKDGQWTLFTFDEEPISNSNWIQNSGTATIEGAPLSGAVIAYICKKYNGVFSCGPQEAGSTTRHWAVVKYGSG